MFQPHELARRLLEVRAERHQFVPVRRFGFGIATIQGLRPNDGGLGGGTPAMAARPSDHPFNRHSFM